jgi:hypothetical protein
MSDEIKRPTRWSYSSISTYRECPAKWKFSYIDNIPWEASAAMDRGTRMHTMCEDYVLGKITYVPTEIKRVGPLLQQLQSLGAKAEDVWLLDKDWNATDDLSKAWVKAIIDVHYVGGDILYVKDYKSGQMYDSHRNQLELYGIMGLMKYPEVKRVETSAVYLDTGHEGMDGSLIRAMLPKTIAKWETDAIKMMSDNDFDPCPGNACRWCDYKKAKGGPCLY